MTDVTDPDLSVRLPQQRRSKERWLRVLDAGYEIVCEGGFEALTIASVCERAGVPPRFIYERVTTKEALLLAVYEHGLLMVRIEDSPFADDALWVDLAPLDVIDLAVRSLADNFFTARSFLRSVVLLSGEHAEILARGSAEVEALQEAFAARVVGAGFERSEVLAVFRLCFSALAFRVAYDQSFFQPNVDDSAMADDLVRTAQRTLGAAHDGRG